MSHINSEERRKAERYKSSIPVLIKTKDHAKIYECTLIDISKNGFAVRVENGKLKMMPEEHFLLIVNASLFDLEDQQNIEINSVCKRIENENNILGAVFYQNTETTEKFINIILTYFKKVNENLY